MRNAGDRINNYLIEEKVGQGAFGEVWRARHHVFENQTVAIKIPTDPQYVQNLRREGVVIHGLRHPNIVRALDLDPYADPPYFIMEFVPGDSLRAFIDAHPHGLPVPIALDILRGILEALDVAHDAGVIHRDIKPANILLNEKIENIANVTADSVRVTDFGLGKVGGVAKQSIMLSADIKNQHGENISGTLAYMSPEQREGRNVDGRSDLYACGVVLFEMIVGERPHGIELPSALRPGLPPICDALFARCYARQDRRFENAAQMLDELNQAPRPRSTTSPGSTRSAGSTSNAPPPRPLSSGHHNRLTCPSCHGKVESQDQYCICCGYQLVETVPRCHGCGAYIHMSDRFCIQCGQDLSVKVG
jgi:serine/threonine-protein kinase